MTGRAVLITRPPAPQSRRCDRRCRLTRRPAHGTARRVAPVATPALAGRGVSRSASHHQGRATRGRRGGVATGHREGRAPGRGVVRALKAGPPVRIGDRRSSTGSARAPTAARRGRHARRRVRQASARPSVGDGAWRPGTVSACARRTRPALAKKLRRVGQRVAAGLARGGRRAPRGPYGHGVRLVGAARTTRSRAGCAAEARHSRRPAWSCSAGSRRSSRLTLAWGPDRCRPPGTHRAGPLQHPRRDASRTDIVHGALLAAWWGARPGAAGGGRSPSPPHW